MRCLVSRRSQQISLGRSQTPLVLVAAKIIIFQNKQLQYQRRVPQCLRDSQTPVKARFAICSTSRDTVKLQKDFPTSHLSSKIFDSSEVDSKVYDIK